MGKLKPRMKYQSNTGMLKVVLPGYKAPFCVSHNFVPLGGSSPCWMRGSSSLSPMTMRTQEFAGGGGRRPGREASALESSKVPVGGVCFLGAMAIGRLERMSACGGEDLWRRTATTVRRQERGRPRLKEDEDEWEIWG